MLDSANPWLEGIDRTKLKTELSVKLSLPVPFVPYAQGSHYPDKKIRFAPAPVQLEFQEELNQQYPLRLISPPGAVVVNTTMGNVPSIIKLAGGEPTLLIHPDDAALCKIHDGQRIQVTSRYGSIERKAVVTADAKQGVVISVGQWWPKLSPDKKSLNDLTSERLTDLGGGSTFGNIAVRISGF
jgi:anaerobic selenocysteine-containing dehydrogenase